MPRPRPIHTGRLRLAPYEPADEEGFVALFLDPRVSRWMGDGLMPEAEVRALFERVFTRVYDREPEEPAFDVWGVWRQGRLIGHAEVKPTDVSGGHELIYALAADHWRQGLGTELSEALAGHAIETLGLSALYATVAAPHHASLAVLRRTGFRHVRDIERDDGHTTRLLVRLPARTGQDGVPESGQEESA